MHMEISSIGQSMDQLNTHIAKDYAYVSVIIAIFFITGILGNALVVRIYYGKFKGNVGSRCFIPILALMDMFSCVFGSALLLVQNNWAASFDSDVLCKGLYLLAYSCNITASLMLTIITVQRYLKICTQSYRKFNSIRKYIFPLAALVGGLATAVPVTVFTGNVVYTHDFYNQSGQRCNIVHTKENQLYFNVYFGMVTLLFIGIAITLTILNALIGRHIFRRLSVRPPRRPSTVIILKYSQKEGQMCSRTLTTENQSVIGNTKCSGDEVTPANPGKHKYSVIFMIISIIFIVTWLPGLVITGLELSKPDLIESLTPIGFTLLRLMDSLFILSNIINPFIYGLCDRQFRKELYSIFSCCQRCRNCQGEHPKTITHS